MIPKRIVLALVGYCYLINHLPNLYISKSIHELVFRSLQDRCDITDLGQLYLTHRWPTMDQMGMVVSERSNSWTSCLSSCGILTWPCSHDGKAITKNADIKTHNWKGIASSLCSWPKEITIHPNVSDTVIEMERSVCVGGWGGTQVRTEMKGKRTGSFSMI